MEIRSGGGDTNNRHLLLAERALAGRGGGDLCSLESPLCSVLGPCPSLFPSLCRQGSCSMGATGHSRVAWTLAPGGDTLTSMPNSSLGPRASDNPTAWSRPPETGRRSGAWRVRLGVGLLWAGMGQAIETLGPEQH